jgi:membrane associated rhomboid family serine protease
MSESPPPEGPSLDAPSLDSPPIEARREPIFNIPTVVIALLAVLIGAYAAFSAVSPDTQDAVLRLFAFQPLRLTLAISPDRFAALLAKVNTDSEAYTEATLIRQHGVALWTILTYAFLHGSWTHVILNSVWLLAFGPPVARRFGASRFLVFFAFTAAVGALTHWAFYASDFTPLVGASAADSGMMGAATRFVFQSGAALGSLDGHSLSERQPLDNVPAPGLFQLLRQRRPVIFIAIWMATNFLFGASAQTLGASEAPVAWLAHVGGFLAGLIAFPLFDRKRPQSA